MLLLLILFIASVHSRVDAAVGGFLVNQNRIVEGVVDNIPNSENGITIGA
jgi:hypothetical protein